MKVGCVGCLGLVAAILVAAVGAAGLIFLSGNILEPPEARPGVKFTRADGLAAQQKLFEIVRRESGTSSRQDPVVISAVEANAFLANHLSAADLPLDPLSVRFEPGRMEIRGRTALRSLIQGPMARVLPYLPPARLEQPIWVTLRGRIIIEPAAAGAKRGKGWLDITDFELGRQPLGAWLLTVMLGPTASRLTSWPLPATVRGVTIDQDQLTIATR